MRKFEKFDELISIIRKFNEIFILDLREKNSNLKKWKDYLDPITTSLFGLSYLEFIKENSLTIPNPPGALEKYYNVFKTIENDFKNLASLEVVNQIYCSTLDVINEFNRFLKINNFRVVNDRELVNGYFISSFKIFPTI